MKNKKTILLFSLAFFLFPVIALAGYLDVRNEDENGKIHAAFGIQSWLSQADAKWQISFPVFTNTGQPAGKIESRLDFKNIDSPVTIITAGGKINTLLSFDALYGIGSISGGHGIDTDRFLPSSGGGLDFSQSTNSLSGDVRMWGINFFYNSKRFGQTNKGPWGMVLGYLHYEDSLVMQNGVQTSSVPFEGIVMPLGPFPGLNSSFDFSWKAFKVGVTHQDLLSKHLSYSGMASFYPYVSYRGEGYWNLRAGNNPSDFRRQPPNFMQDSSQGYGFDATLGLLYHVSENIELSAGYRYFYLYASNGTDTVFFADGSSAQSKLDWATVTRHGAYAELMFRF
jgi:opacity protein-like surface antigen